MEENKQEVQEQNEEKLNDKIKRQVEDKINEILDKNGVQSSNVDYLYKLVDIHKDISNEDYWNKKKEALNMNYRYGNYEEDYPNYGRRGMPGTGRGNYGRRGVPGTGRGRYRGEDMLEDMHEMYSEYSDGKEEYNRGNYGAKDDTMRSLDYMLKSVVQFMQMLEEDASSDEEMQLIKKYARKISEM